LRSGGLSFPAFFIPGNKDASCRPVLIAVEIMPGKGQIVTQAPAKKQLMYVEPTAPERSAAAKKVQAPHPDKPLSIFFSYLIYHFFEIFRPSIGS